MIAMLALVVSAEFHLHQSTQRADWYALKGLKVDVAACEQFLKKTEEQLGARVPRFTYMRVKSPQDIFRFSESHTFAYGLAELESLRVYSTESCSRHEIVHLVTAQIVRPAPLFEEGTATMLGRDTRWCDGWYVRWQARVHARRQGWHFDSANEVLPGGLIRRARPVVWYLVADSWVRYLVKRYGMAKLVEFFQASDQFEDVHMVFEMVYGLNLNATFDQWLYGSSRK